MLLDLQVGTLCEPLSGRRWERSTVAQQVLLRVAYYRQAGLCRGDRVVIVFGNTLEFFADLLAIWHLGACAVPVDSRLTPFEIETLAKAAAPRLALYLDALAPAVRAPLTALGIGCIDSSEAGAAALPARVPPSPLTLDADALILFTSGSTGNPKGVVHTQRSLRACWTALRHSLGLERYRRTLCLLPTHFGHGLIGNCLFPWLSGHDLFILPAGNVAAVAQLGPLLDEHAITFMSSVPPIWRLALKTSRPPQKRALERVFCGSAPLAAHLWRQIREWCGTQEVCNAYGITETGWVGGTTVGPVEPEDGLIGVSWGAVIKIMKESSPDRPPGLGEECRAGEPGFVWLNTPTLMRGYFERDDLTRQVVSQGWFITGDIGVLDERGWLYLRGRERDEINRGGTKVYPSDIEAVVERCAGVTDVCCFAIDDRLYGQAVAMAVVLAQRDDATVRALSTWMRQHLAAFQLPTRWYLLEAIPRTSRGKVNRQHVADACATVAPMDIGTRPSAGE